MLFGQSDQQSSQAKHDFAEHIYIFGAHPEQWDLQYYITFFQCLFIYFFDIEFVHFNNIANDKYITNESNYLRNNVNKLFVTTFFLIYMVTLKPTR